MAIARGMLAHGVKKRRGKCGAAHTRREHRVALPVPAAIELLRRLELSRSVAAGLWLVVMDDTLAHQCEVLGANHSMSETLRCWGTATPVRVAIAGVELHSNVGSTCHRFGMRQPLKPPSGRMEDAYAMQSRELARILSQECSLEPWRRVILWMRPHM